MSRENLENEETRILATMAWTPSLIPWIAVELKPHHFRSPQYRNLFMFLTKGHISKEFSGTREHLHSLLDDAGQLYNVGGPNVLEKIFNILPIGNDDLGSHCKRLRDSSHISIYGEALRKAQSVLEGPGGKIEDANRIVQKANVETSFNGHQSPGIQRFCTEAMKEFESDRKPKGGMAIKTGFVDFDRVNGGLFPGETTLILGRPSMGKTALTLDMALHIATTKKVHVFTLESTAKTLFYRLLAKEAGVSVRKIRTAEYNNDELARLIKSAGELYDLKLSITQCPGMTPDMIAQEILADDSRTGEETAVAIVDYLQICRPNTKQGSREREVANVMEDLTALAVSYNWHLIIPTQANRECEKRPLRDRIPRIYEIRDSGMAEQGADNVISLVRLDHYLEASETHTEKNTMDLLILKSKNGKIGQFKLFWDPERMRARNMFQQEDRL